MKHLAPAYYGAFTCLADRCRDNCCIGWEIGIDPDTAAFYDSFPGETGDWLRSGITPPGTEGGTGALPHRYPAGKPGGGDVLPALHPLA